MEEEGCEGSISEKIPYPYVRIGQIEKHPGQDQGVFWFGVHAVRGERMGTGGTGGATSRAAAYKSLIRTLVMFSITFPRQVYLSTGGFSGPSGYMSTSYTRIIPGTSASLFFGSLSCMCSRNACRVHSSGGLCFGLHQQSPNELGCLMSLGEQLQPLQFQASNLPAMMF